MWRVGSRHSLGACRARANPIELVDYGLQRTFYRLGFGYRPCHRGHRETVDARKRSRRLHHYHSARYCGAFVGTWIGRLFAGENYVAGWIMSIVGAMILLLLYRLIFRRRM
jgi:hypothetical protein